MDSFVFALDTTMPVFLVILLGWFLRRVGVLNEAFCKPADQYVFKCALPVSLFLSIAKMDVYSDFDPMFCLFCFTVTAIVFLGVWALTSRLMKDKALVGEFSQAAVRSSAAILGVALNTNIYGNAGMVPMMVLSAVPFFNVYAVLILQFSPHTDENGRLIPPERNGAAAVRRALVNVVKNPIILGILLGVPFSLLRVKLPGILASTLSTIGGTATLIGVPPNIMIGSAAGLSFADFVMGDGDQAVHPPGDLPADCGAVWLYRQRDDRDFDFGRLADDGFLLCDGQKHGAQGRADQQCGHAGDGAFLRVADAVDFSAAAVRAAVSG